MSDNQTEAAIEAQKIECIFLGQMLRPPKEITEAIIKRLLDEKDRNHAAITAEKDAKIERLKQQLAEAKSESSGYDRRGKTCGCLWGSDVHGDCCPEHGDIGVVVLSLNEKVEQLRQQLASVVSAIDAEPELPGKLTDSLLKMIGHVGVEQSMKYLVRQTKDSIRNRIQQLAEADGSCETCGGLGLVFWPRENLRTIQSEPCPDCSAETTNPDGGGE